jgi:hypothetical protein
VALHLVASQIVLSSIELVNFITGLSDRGGISNGSTGTHSQVMVMLTHSIIVP